MNKRIKGLRTIFTTGGAKPKLCIAVTLGIPGFLKIEVRYARGIGHKPPKEA